MRDTALRPAVIVSVAAHALAVSWLPPLSVEHARNAKRMRWRANPHVNSEMLTQPT